MAHANASTRRSGRASTARLHASCKPLSVESLERRELLSASPQFHVVDDATANVAFRYDVNGPAQGSSALAAANAAPRGVATFVGSDKTWVVDANRNVYVYNTSGALLGSWAAGSLGSTATPEGIATDGADIWIVDSKSDKIYRYAGAASRLSGSQNAASSFNLFDGRYGNGGASNLNPKDIVTDGASVWVVDDGTKVDRVFKYSIVTSSSMGYWTIDAANKAPSGIAIDPGSVGDIWISDSGTDRVYRYAGAVTRSDYGSQSAAGSFPLAPGDGNAQGIAMSHPWAETPYQVSWVRQFGTSAEDYVGGLAADANGNIFVSGGTAGSLTVANPTGNFTSYLARFDTAGNPNFVHQDNPVPGIDNNGFSVRTDSLGNVFQVVSDSLRKFDASGAPLWTSNVPSGEHYWRLAVDELDNAYIASYGGNFLHLRKFDGATGQLVWQQDLDTGGVTGAHTSVAADGLGNVYLVGAANTTVLGPNAGGYDVLLAKYSDAGVPQWTRQFGSGADDLGRSVWTDAFGNVYTSGFTYGSLGGTYAGGQDSFLAMHDANGNLLWIRQFGATTDNPPSQGWIDPAGNIFEVISANEALGGAHLGGGDLAVVKYDPSGSLLWATQFGTVGDEVRSIDSITGDAQGNVYVGGKTSGSWGGTNAGGYDAVVFKLSPPTTPAPMMASAMSPTLGHPSVTDEVLQKFARESASARSDAASMGPSLSAAQSHVDASPLAADHYFDALFATADSPAPKRMRRSAGNW